ncbi:MAG: hypothetical protein GXN93_00180, partial [Candidatus Diapherotrites archaeon]|nr:hypothetical protein [Candidatus Diapherotrites archaeon]
PTNAPDYLTLGSWTTCAYKDINNIVFAVNVATGTAYDGSTVDFESVVPASNSTAVTYYIYKA